MRAKDAHTTIGEKVLSKSPPKPPYKPDQNLRTHCSQSLHLEGSWATVQSRKSPRSDVEDFVDALSTPEPEHKIPTPHSKRTVTLLQYKVLRSCRVFRTRGSQWPLSGRGEPYLASGQPAIGKRRLSIKLDAQHCRRRGKLSFASFPRSVLCSC